MYRNSPSIFGLHYVIIEIIVAAHCGYLQGFSSVSSIISALLAILFWPALFLGANLHVNLGV